MHYYEATLHINRLYSTQHGYRFLAQVSSAVGPQCSGPVLWAFPLHLSIRLACQGRPFLYQGDQQCHQSKLRQHIQYMCERVESLLSRDADEYSIITHWQDSLIVS